MSRGTPLIPTPNSGNPMRLKAHLAWNTPTKFNDVARRRAQAGANAPPPNTIWKGGRRKINANVATRMKSRRKAANHADPEEPEARAATPSEMEGKRHGKSNPNNTATPRGQNST